MTISDLFIKGRGSLRLPPTLRFQMIAVRSDCELGSVCFVLPLNDFVWRIYTTNLHFSKEVGATGVRHLNEQFQLLVSLQSRRIGQPNSATLPKQLFQRLTSGTIFPALVLKDRRDDYWADDFADLVQTGESTRIRLRSHGPQFLDAIEIVRSQLRSAA